MSRRKECSHMFANGDTCGSPALTGHDYCYYHVRYQHKNQAGDENYELPILEDRDSVQLFISDVIRGMLSNKLELRKANALLYAAQIALANLARWEKMKEQEAEAQEEEDGEEPEQPFMFKFLGDALAGAKVASGPDTGKSVSEVFARNLADAAEKNKK